MASSLARVREAEEEVTMVWKDRTHSTVAVFAGGGGAMIQGVGEVWNLEKIRNGILCSLQEGTWPCRTLGFQLIEIHDFFITMCVCMCMVCANVHALVCVRRSEVDFVALILSSPFCMGSRERTQVATYLLNHLACSCPALILVGLLSSTTLR